MNRLAGNWTQPVLLILLAALVLCGCGTTVRAVDDTPSAPPPALQIFHTVLAGETVWAIGRTYGVPANAIIDANDLDDVSDIPIGRKLLIPGATELRSVPPADLYGKHRPGPVLDWPVAGREILSYFGEQRRTHRHTGLDIRGNRGDPVTAADDGIVTCSGTMRGYGKTVILDHGDGLETLYAHNTALLVQVGDKVIRGQTIATVGRTGNASTEHSHFEVRKDGVAVDPLKFL